jgi:hypothetical protein
LRRELALLWEGSCSSLFRPCFAQTLPIAEYAINTRRTICVCEHNWFLTLILPASQFFVNPRVSRAYRLIRRHHSRRTRSKQTCQTIERHANFCSCGCWRRRRFRCIGNDQRTKLRTNDAVNVFRREWAFLRSRPFWRQQIRTTGINDCSEDLKVRCSFCCISNTRARFRGRGGSVATERSIVEGLLEQLACHQCKWSQIRRWDVQWREICRKVVFKISVASERIHTGEVNKK